ncbi:hypothetical protein HCJ39_07220 [Listeria rocourtiae]|uniref:hypothetical protein n=1 Tax=Listeria rocourtiae TaxID=647910 RepID=UPI001624F7E7|nr:hypothetical protein [Listeria rocourtiae]MBC1604501.1 hypothetical protein [Listeria rocourtiae]
MVNVSEGHVCLSKYGNDSLRIDIINDAFDVLVECTVETDSVYDFEGVKGFSEQENNKIYRMHSYNLIVAMDRQAKEIVQFLQGRDIIEESPVYFEKNGKRMLAYYKLTDQAITQKCDIIDEDAYTRVYTDEMQESLYGLPYNDFIYKVKDGVMDFAAIYFNKEHSYFEYGTTVASTLEEVRDYLVSQAYQIKYCFHGTDEQVDQKLFQLRRRVENAKELIK